MVTTVMIFEFGSGDELFNDALKDIDKYLKENGLDKTVETNNGPGKRCAFCGDHIGIIYTPSEKSSVHESTFGVVDYYAKSNHLLRAEVWNDMGPAMSNPEMDRRACDIGYGLRGVISKKYGEHFGVTLWAFPQGLSELQETTEKLIEITGQNSRKQMAKINGSAAP